MPIPLYLKRERRRTNVKVKKDVEETKKILRQDVYDILKNSFDKGKTKIQASVDLREALNGLNTEALSYKGDKQKGIERVISDIDSYGIDWSING